RARHRQGRRLDDRCERKRLAAVLQSIARHRAGAAETEVVAALLLALQLRDRFSGFARFDLYGGGFFLALLRVHERDIVRAPRDADMDLWRGLRAPRTEPLAGAKWASVKLDQIRERSEHRVGWGPRKTALFRGGAARAAPG